MNALPKRVPPEGYDPDVSETPPPREDWIVELAFMSIVRLSPGLSVSSNRTVIRALSHYGTEGGPLWRTVEVAPAQMRVRVWYEGKLTDLPEGVTLGGLFDWLEESKIESDQERFSLRKYWKGKGMGVDENLKRLELHLPDNS